MSGYAIILTIVSALGADAAPAADVVRVETAPAAADVAGTVSADPVASAGVGEATDGGLETAGQPVGAAGFGRSGDSGLSGVFMTIVALAGISAIAALYMKQYMTHTLEVEPITPRLKLLSMLPLPRRPGLFLFQVEGTAVLVGMDSSGIRNIIALDELPAPETAASRQEPAAERTEAPRFESLSADGFNEIYEELREVQAEIHSPVNPGQLPGSPHSQATHS